MPVILALIGLVSAVAVALVYSGQFWPVYHAVRRALGGGPRSVLGAFDDPRDIATIFMLMIARRKGDISDRQVAAIREQMRNVLQLDNAKDVEERLTVARVAAANAGSFNTALTDALPQLRRKVDRPEFEQMSDMLTSVSTADGPATEDQEIDIQLFRRKTGLIVG